MVHSSLQKMNNETNNLSYIFNFEIRSSIRASLSSSYILLLLFLFLLIHNRIVVFYFIFKLNAVNRLDIKNFSICSKEVNVTKLVKFHASAKECSYFPLYVYSFSIGYAMQYIHVVQVCMQCYCRHNTCLKMMN